MWKTKTVSVKDICTIVSLQRFAQRAKYKINLMMYHVIIIIFKITLYIVATKTIKTYREISVAYIIGAVKLCPLWRDVVSQYKVIKSHHFRNVYTTK